MLRKLRRSCRLTHKRAHSPQLMIALTLMLMLSSLMAPIASTIEAASVANNSGQTEELASQTIEPTPTPTSIFRPATNLQVQQLQPLVPIDTDPTVDPGRDEDQDQNNEQDEDQNQDDEQDQDNEQDENQNQDTNSVPRPAAIQVNLYWCDENVNLANAPVNDYAMGESLKTQCGMQAAPVTVRLTSTTASTQPMESSVTSFPGSTTFSPLSMDTWTIDVLPKVVVTTDLFNCNGLTPYGNTKPYSTYARILADKPTFGIDTLNEEEIVCDWFGQVPDTSSLNITKWNCPEGFDFAAQGYDAARGTCWDAVNPPVEFTVKNTEQNNTFEEKRATDPNNNDEVFFPVIPQGNLEVTEAVPNGYGLVAVYCAINANAANMVNLTQADMFALKANGGDAIRCDVFDTLGATPGIMGQPMGTDDTGTSLTIYKWECPPGTDPGNNDHSYFSGECDTQKADVPFTIIDGSANSPISTTSDIDGRQIDGLVPDGSGNITIIETIPSGYRQPIVFCKFLNDDESTKKVVVEGGVIVAPGDNTDSIQCFWYNIPSTPPSTGYGNVHVYKWICSTTPAMDAPYQWFVDNCTMPLDGVTFTLDTPNVVIQTDTGDTGNAGYAQMDGVEAGTYPLTELPEPGYTLVGVYCAYQTGDTEPGTGDYQMYTPTNGSIDANVVADQTLRCNFFNLAEPTSFSLTIYKWDCPAGTDPTSNDDTYYSGECATEMAGVPFTIVDGSANSPIATTSDTNGRQIDNLVPDANGYITITEDIPAGYGTPVVFCRALNDPASTHYQVTNGSVLVPTPVDDDLQCFWYNIPTSNGTGEVQIKKWDCGNAFITDSSADPNDPAWLSTNCTTPQDGVEFTLNGMTVTTVSGYAEFTNLAPGTYDLTETVPDGYAPVSVVCALASNMVDPNDVVYGGAVNVMGGAVTLEVLADHNIYCNWYNKPVGDGDIQITKWDCGPYTPPSDPTATWFETNCTTPMENVTFSVNTDPVTSQMTDGFGSTTFADLPEGMYEVTETVPDGYESAAVVCGLASDMVDPNDVVYGALETVGSGSLSVEVLADHVVYCKWYNVQDPGNTIHVTKWECPEGTELNPMPTLQWFQDNCQTRLSGVDFSLTTSAGTTTQTTDIDGETKFAAVPPGSFTLAEAIPTGYSPYPVVVCGGTIYLNGAIGDMFPMFVSAPGGQWSYMLSEGQWTIHCDFYNIPEKPSTVIIYKWSCPEGVTPEPTIQWHQDNCTMAMDGVDFTLTDIVGPRLLTTTGGMVAFTDVATGPIQIKETIPAGYSNQPFLVCQFTYADGSGTGQYSPTPVNGVYNTTIDQPGSEFRCDWYNHKVGPGEITVYKWTCPEGYDRTAWGADPMVDCTQATNGVTFQLIQNPPAVLSQSDTGDSIQGAVYFGGLEPDTYVLNEILTPEQSMNLKEAFIWQCYGLTTSSVQPYPLNVGQIFQFEIVGGDNIVCHWFNVPKTPHGWLDVTKFNCTTEKYVADVYCYTNQTGQEFNLQKLDGATWTTVASGITDVNGKLSFTGLTEGNYRLVEPNKEACLIKSSNIVDGKYIGVKNGEGTTVYVYNCKTPPPPNDKPGKYPNTGVGPDATASQEQRMPGIELAGLIGLAGVSMSRRRFLKRAAGVTLGAGALALPAVAAQDLVSLDSTPAPATPGANILGCGTPSVIGPDDGTPAPGTPVWEDPCTRGAVPLRFRIPIIGVDAEVEYLEIIDGQMQPPTGAEDVTWYKETSRLGEVGNGIYAGHLNYWGIPEGVFFRLESLQEGDVIEIDGDDAQTYTYVVQWMQNFPSDEEPPEEALGATNEKAITVITCGGEWVSARAEYDHRTLVRAVLLEDQA